jgi:hypothetical protein
MATDSAALERESATEEPRPTLGSEHQRLDAFFGKWKSEGRTEAGASGPAEDMIHEHTYEWLPGRFFLQHRWDGRVGDRDSKGIEIIGFDASSQAYASHFFDSDGWSRIYRGTVRDRVWTFTGERERCTVTFSGDGNTMNIHWEQSHDSEHWRSLCHMQSTRVG